MTDSVKRARDILELTLGMTAHAEAGRWEELPALEAARAALIAGWEPAAGPAMNGDLAACLEQIVAANDRLIRECEQQRDHLMALLRGSHRQRRAAHAYEDGARTV